VRVEVRFPRGLWLGLSLLQDWWLCIPLFALGLETRNDFTGDVAKTLVAYLLIMTVVIALFRWPRIFVFDGAHLEARRGLLGTARVESLVIAHPLTFDLEHRARNRVAILAHAPEGSSIRLVTFFVLTRRNVEAVLEVARALEAALGQFGR